MTRIRQYRVNINDLFFFTTYFFYIILMMYGTTMFMEKIQISSSAYTIARIILLVCLFGLMFFNSKLFTLKQILLVILLGITILFVVFFTGYTTLLDAYLLSICAVNINIKKICKFFFIVAGIFFGITVLFSIMGIIQNLTYTMNFHVRKSFGFIYPTDFAAHCFYLWLAYWGTKNRKFKLYDMAISIVLSVFLYKYCYAKLDAILFIVGGVLFWIFEKKYEMLNLKFIKKIMTYSFLAIFTISALISIFYRNTGVWIILDNLFTHRLSSGHDAFNKYGLSFFGQYIRQQGFGWSVESFDMDFGYFFIDNGYLRLLFCYGVILSIIVITSAVSAVKHFYLKKNWKMIIILFLISISNFADCRFMDPAYSSFFIIYYCSWLYMKKMNLEEDL